MEAKGLVNAIMRGLQFLWTLLVMAIIGNMIAESNGGNPSIINYCMFVAVFSMLSLLFLIPATIKPSWGLMPIIPFVLDLLNMLFWFCGAVALAAQLGVHGCGNKDYVNNNKITLSGKSGSSTRCHEAQASDAFLFFGWAAFAVSCVLTGLGLSGGGATSRGGIRRGGPSMSQV